MKLGFVYGGASPVEGTYVMHWRCAINYILKFGATTHGVSVRRGGHKINIDILREYIKEDKNMC